MGRFAVTNKQQSNTQTISKEGFVMTKIPNRVHYYTRFSMYFYYTTLICIPLVNGLIQ